MVEVVVELECEGTNWYEVFAKRFLWPTLLPVGSAICFAEGDNFTFDFCYVHSYFWSDKYAEQVHCLLTERITDQKCAKEEFATEIEQLGWLPIADVVNSPHETAETETDRPSAAPVRRGQVDPDRR